MMAAPALPGSQAAKDAVKPAAVKVEPTAEAKARLAKINAQSKAINDKNKAKREAADAKFKAEGWFQIERGIYGRWCTDTCSRAEVIGTASYWLLEVYCKERACGDIYAQLNISKGGTVVGWTNDTAYLGYGKKVFSPSKNMNWATAPLTKAALSSSPPAPDHMTKPKIHQRLHPFPCPRNRPYRRSSTRQRRRPHHQLHRPLCP